MKTLFLGDTHGRSLWKEIINKENPNRVIFIGDYFDNFDIPGVEQLHNLKEIIDFKKSTDIDVILLFGNHDYHYYGSKQTYSGYQHGMAWEFGNFLKENREHFQMAYLMDNILCSHAGISYTWLTNTFGNENDESCENWSLDDLSGLVNLINEYFIFKPNVFEFNGWDPYGNDVTQSPIWIRPDALLASNKNTLKNKVIQIVGHTRVSNIFEMMKTSKKAMGNKYYLIDALDTKGYLIHENNQFIAKQL